MFTYSDKGKKNIYVPNYLLYQDLEVKPYDIC